MEIVIATRNKKKLSEFRRILEGTDIRILSLDDFPSCPEIEETGKTFKENAIKKALEVSRFTGRLAISDDSGLEVDALLGAPGVYSARYAGASAGDKDNVEKLLKELKDVPDKERTARFICVIALVYPDGTTKTFEGEVRGTIGKTPKGNSGFGYDPVFYPEGYDRTFAEMTPQEKDSLSHRARALQKLTDFLKSDK